jgi:hypothetical protein
MPRLNNRLTFEEGTEYRRRLIALGKTQEWAALKIGKKPGPFSRWIRGEFASMPNRKKLDALLAREEAKRGLSPPTFPLGKRNRVGLYSGGRPVQAAGSV